MRLWLLLPLAVACADPPRRPPQKPADPNAVNGCRSAPGTLGSMHYTCANYVLIDSVGKGTTRSVEADLVAAATRQNITSSSRVVAVDGVGETLLVEYREPRAGHSFALLATTTAGEDTRLVQCHMQWYVNADSQASRQKACEDGIRALLARPAPVRVEISDVCKRAAEHLPTLPGHPEDPMEMRTAMRAFADSCTDKLAACTLAATSYVESTLCRN